MHSTSPQPDQSQPDTSPPQSPRGGTLLGLAVGVVFLASTIPLLKDYGPGWDVSILYYGERFVDFYASGFDEETLDFTKPLDPAPVFDLPTEGPMLAWPLGPTSAALTRRAFSESRDWLDPVEGYNICSLILMAFTLGSLASWVRVHLGWLAALASAFFLATYPSFLGLTLQNPKDMPAAALFSCAIIAGARALEAQSRARTLWFGVVLGLAFSGKTNAIFVPAILVLWWALSALIPSWRFPKQALRMLPVSTFATVVMAPLIMLALWPWLWQDVIGNLGIHFERVQQNRHGEAAFGTSFEEALMVSPLVVVGFALVGLLSIGRPKTPAAKRLLLLAFLWMAIPLLRASLPNIRYYDGIRRYVEFVPGLCLLAGYGASWLWSAASRLPRRQWMGRTAVALGIACAAIPVIRFHPFELAYYNALAGGLKGAQERGYSGASDYWAASYRGAFAWLKENAEEGAKVIVPVAPHVAKMANHVYGRADLDIQGPPPPIRPEQLSSDYYVLFITKVEYYDGLAHYCMNNDVRAVIAEDRDGAPLLRLFKVEQGTPHHAALLKLSEQAYGEDAEEVLAMFAQKARERPPNRKAIGQYIHKLVQLRSVDVAIQTVRELMEDIEDPTLIQELEFYIKQLDDSREFSDR